MILWEAAVVVSHYWIKKAGTFLLLLPLPLRAIFHLSAPALSYFHTLCIRSIGEN